MSDMATHNDEPAYFGCPCDAIAGCRECGMCRDCCDCRRIRFEAEGPPETYVHRRPR